MNGRENKKKPNPTDVHVGSRIRLRRNMLGMSQEKLGETLGITFQQIQKYEKGVNRISAGRLQRIADVLAIPTQSLMGADKSNTANDRHVFEFLNAPDAVQLLEAYSRIRVRKMRLVLVHLANTLAESCIVEPS